MAKATVRRHSEEVEISDFAGCLRIDKNDLDTALMEQPDLFYRVSQQLALAISRRDQEKLDRDNMISETANHIRLKAEKRGEKVTEKGLAELVEIDEEVVAVKRDYIKANAVAEEWLALKEALSQRGHALRELVQLYNANYFTTASGRSARDGAESRRADEVRAEGGRVRRERLERDR